MTLKSRVAAHTIAASSLYYYISPDFVKSALDAQLYGRGSRAPNPLEHMALIDEILADPTFPPCAHGRSIALSILLNRRIEVELDRHRLAMGIPPSQPNRSIQDAFKAIEADQQTANRELLGWSWLYYHYVRVELGIEPSHFCSVCHIDVRTLGRYRARALERLAEFLVEQEWQVERRNRGRTALALG